MGSTATVLSFNLLRTLEREIDLACHDGIGKRLEHPAVTGVLLTGDLQDEVSHAVTIDVTAEGRGVTRRIIGQCRLTGLLGESLHKAEGLIPRERAIGIDARQVDKVTLDPVKICDPVGRREAAIADGGKHELICTAASREDVLPPSARQDIRARIADNDVTQPIARAINGRTTGQG